MLGNFGQVGWGNPDEEVGEKSGSGGGYSGGMSEKERFWKFRFRILDPAKNMIQVGRPITHRVMFLSSVPFRVYEHGLYKDKHATDHYTAMCLSKNDLDPKGCPICQRNDKGDYAYMVGLLGLINMGQVEYIGPNDVRLHPRTWRNKDGETVTAAFERQLYAGRFGNQENPGPMRELFWEAEKLGGTLDGTVWDLTRTGQKKHSVGDRLSFVERIPADKWVEYLTSWGADGDDLNVTPPEKESENGWHDVCQIVGYDELARIVGGGQQQGQQGQQYNQGQQGGQRQQNGQGRRVDGAGYDAPQQGQPATPNGYGDDIPF